MFRLFFFVSDAASVRVACTAAPSVAHEARVSFTAGSAQAHGPPSSLPSASLTWHSGNGHWRTITGHWQLTPKTSWYFQGIDTYDTKNILIISVSTSAENALPHEQDKFEKNTSCFLPYPARVANLFHQFFSWFKSWVGFFWHNCPCLTSSCEDRWLNSYGLRQLQSFFFYNFNFYNRPI